MRLVGSNYNAWTNGFGENCAVIVSSNASAAAPWPGSSGNWACPRFRLADSPCRGKVRGVWPSPGRRIQPCLSNGFLDKGSFHWSSNMMRYDIEETAVYVKYVRWCGRTGP